MATEPQTPGEALRHAVEANHRHVFGLWNVHQNLVAGLGPGRPLRQVEMDVLSEIEFGLRRALDDARTIEADVKLLVPA